MQLFGRPVDEISRIANHVMHYIYERFHNILNTFDHRRLNPETLEKFARAVQARDGTLPDTWGFIDLLVSLAL